MAFLTLVGVLILWIINPNKPLTPAVVSTTEPGTPKISQFVSVLQHANQIQRRIIGIAFLLMDGYVERHFLTVLDNDVWKNEVLTATWWNALPVRLGRLNPSVGILHGQFLPYEPLSIELNNVRYGIANIRGPYRSLSVVSVLDMWQFDISQDHFWPMRQDDGGLSNRGAALSGFRGSSRSSDISIDRFESSERGPSRNRGYKHKNPISRSGIPLWCLVLGVGFLIPGRALTPVGGGALGFVSLFVGFALLIVGVR